MIQWNECSNQNIKWIIFIFYGDYLLIFISILDYPHVVLVPVMQSYSLSRSTIYSTYSIVIIITKCTQFWGSWIYMTYMWSTTTKFIASWISLLCDLQMLNRACTLAIEMMWSCTLCSIGIMCIQRRNYETCRIQWYQQYMHSFESCWHKCDHLLWKNSWRAGLLGVDIDNINTYKQCVPAASTNVRSQKNKPSCIIRTFCLTLEIEILDVTVLTDCYEHISYWDTYSHCITLNKAHWMHLTVRWILPWIHIVKYIYITMHEHGMNKKPIHTQLWCIAVKLLTIRKINGRSNLYLHHRSIEIPCVVRRLLACLHVPLSHPTVYPDGHTLHR